MIVYDCNLAGLPLSVNWQVWAPKFSEGTVKGPQKGRRRCNGPSPPVPMQSLKANERIRERPLASTKSSDSLFFHSSSGWVRQPTTRAWPFYQVFVLHFFVWQCQIHSLSSAASEFEGFKQVVSSTVCENGL